MADLDWRELSNNQRDVIEQQRKLIVEMCDERDSARAMLADANELLATRELQITALRQALHEATSLHDATDPGPKLVAETRSELIAQASRIAQTEQWQAFLRACHDIPEMGQQLWTAIGQQLSDAHPKAAFPINALRGGNGVPK